MERSNINKKTTVEIHVACHSNTLILNKTYTSQAQLSFKKCLKCQILSCQLNYNHSFTISPGWSSSYMTDREAEKQIIQIAGSKRGGFEDEESSCLWACVSTNPQPAKCPECKRVEWTAFCTNNGIFEYLTGCVKFLCTNEMQDDVLSVFL